MVPSISTDTGEVVASWVRMKLMKLTSNCCSIGTPEISGAETSSNAPDIGVKAASPLNLRLYFSGTQSLL